MEEEEKGKEKETIEAEDVPVEDVPRTYWLPGPVYTALKWVVLIALPALGAFYSGLAGVWGWPLATEVTQTCSYLALFGGALIGLSAARGSLAK